MKMIRVNGIDAKVPDGVIVFEEFIRDLNQELVKNNLVISSILVDGREISEAEENAIKACRIDELQNVEVITANPIDLAYETLNTLEKYIEKIMLGISRAAQNYRKKNLVSADTYFAKSIDGLDLFVQTVAGVKLALRVGLNPKVALAEASLVSIMNDLLEAKRQNNYVFMSELLEKDLIENLCEWRDIVFPIFRMIKSA